MGCGTWTSSSFTSYSTSMGRSVSFDGCIRDSYSNQDMFKSKTIDSALNPKYISKTGGIINPNSPKSNKDGNIDTIHITNPNIL